MSPHRPVTLDDSVQAYLKGNRGFFRWDRILHALYDPTGLTEILLGLIGFAMKGAFMFGGFTGFPPPSVGFMLRQLPIPLTEPRLAWSLVLLGVFQALAVGTKSHELRGWTAVCGGLLSMTIAMAYIFAGLAEYFSAWIAYAGLAIIEGWLLYRNFRDGRRERNARRHLTGVVGATV